MQYKKTGLTVSDVSRLFQGKSVDKKKCNEEKKGLPVIVGASSLQEGGVKIVRWIETPAPTAVLSKFGDILISAQGTCGKVGINNIGDAVITDAIIAVRPIPPLVDPYFLVVVIVEAIENQHVIPEFDDDTIGFQRCIKSDLIGGIEFMPLDLSHQVENVQAMKDFVTSFRELHPDSRTLGKNGVQCFEEMSLDECVKEMAKAIRRQNKAFREIKDFSESLKNKEAKKIMKIMQEELF